MGPASSDICPEAYGDEGKEGGVRNRNRGGEDNITLHSHVEKCKSTKDTKIMRKNQPREYCRGPCTEGSSKLGHGLEEWRQAGQLLLGGSPASLGHD